MRVAFALFILVCCLASMALAASGKSREKKNKERNHLRSDHRDLQHFPYLKTAAIPVQPAAEKEEEETEVVTVESALTTPAENDENSPSSEESSGVDIGYAFNKWTMYPSEYDGEPFTLTREDYPLDDDMAHTLAYKSNAYSVVTQKDVRMEDHDVTHYIEGVGGLPPRPTTDPKDPYWNEFKEVVKRSRGRQLGRLPPAGIFRPPRLWENFNATEVAEAVHDEVSV